MRQALLLDRNYMALSLVSWKKAIRLLVTGKAEGIGDASLVRIPYSSGNFSIPSILRLLVVIPWKAHLGRLKFGRKNMLIRDDHKCQYCGSKVGHDASIDHIIPKSRGGQTDYSNCVTCCQPCNNIKADKTPEEAGMKLMRKPRKPTFLTLHKYFTENPPEEWRNYLIGFDGNENNIR